MQVPSSLLLSARRPRRVVRGLARVQAIYLSFLPSRAPRRLGNQKAAAVRLDHEMEPLPDDSPLPEPRSKIQDGAYFNTPMQLTPGQRVHTVEGPGRQSGTNRCIGTQQERMVNTGEQAPGFKRRSGGSTAMPVAPTGPTTFAPLAEGPSPPKAADSCLPQEPPPQTSAESSIGAAPPSRPAAQRPTSSGCGAH